MEKKLYDLMDWPDIEGIIYSDLTNPKKLLGQRVTKHGLLIQAYYPAAIKATVKVKKTGVCHEMEMADEEGYFAVLISDKKKLDYTLVFELSDGEIVETEDVYNYPSLIPAKELKAFVAGNNTEIYKYLGAHVTEVEGVKGVLFAVWAPNAMRVSVVGDFNGWDGRIHQMEKIEDYGVFELFIPGVTEGAIYKYEIRKKGNAVILKADPYGFRSELRPNTASIVYDMDKFKWTDEKWIESREENKYKKQPFSIYEIHPGSFAASTDGNTFINYRELAPMVIAHVKKMGYTHIGLMPVMEHPLDESWGYQVTGYYAPTARYGTPDDFKYFMNEMHKAGIGVILDWVPAHFPKDDAGLSFFDGTCLYEHMDKRKGEHPEWGTLIYNFGRPEVCNFLMANAIFWAKEYHADGIRMDAVASMLYLDYGRRQGEWEPNMYGGHENLEAVEFLKKVNGAVKKNCDGVILIAEESTAWPKVTGDIKDEALGFDYKWNTGWMNSFLDFMSCDPLFRKGRYDELTFSMIYAYSEDFILALPHTEFSHGRGSLYGKMPGGTKAEKLSNLRAAFAYMYTHPGKKLMFMGQDIAVCDEWWEGSRINWTLESDEDKQFAEFVKDLNKLYAKEAALYESDFSPEGFEWINNISGNECVISFVRRAENGDELVVVANFTPVDRANYKIGVPHVGKYKEIFNTNDIKYGGDGKVNKRAIASKKDECDGREDSIRLNVPSMGVTVLRYSEPAPKKETPKKETPKKETPKKETPKKKAPKKTTAKKSATKK